MNEIELAWLAGLLEGEGSFMTGPPSDPGCSRIALQMTDRDVVEHVAKIFGVRYRTTRKQAEHHKQPFAVTLKGERAVALMISLYPYMGERRQEQIQRAVWSYPVSRRRPERKHGELYTRGCRCKVCREGHKDYMRTWRERQQVAAIDLVTQ